MTELIVGISSILNVGLFTLIFYRVGKLEGKNLNGLEKDMDTLRRSCPQLQKKE